MDLFSEVHWLRASETGASVGCVGFTVVGFGVGENEDAARSIWPRAASDCWVVWRVAAPAATQVALRVFGRKRFAPRVPAREAGGCDEVCVLLVAACDMTRCTMRFDVRHRRR